MSSLSPGLKLSAYLLGRRIAGQRRKPERVPVAYLYNGVRLPPIPPEIAKYPYIAIWQEPESGAFANYCYIVGMSTAPSSWEQNFTFYTKEMHGTTESGEWKRAGTYPDSEKWSIDDTYTDMYSNDLSKVKWANYPVFNPDGSLYLAASDPVPVYE